MTLFDVRIPGLPMSGVQADGHCVQPVTVDEMRLGVAETYDVIVQPQEDQAYTIFAQPESRGSYARGTLAPRMGMTAAIPPMDPFPLRTMADMGMGRMAQMKGMKMSGMSSDQMPGMKDMQMNGPRQNSMPEMKDNSQHVHPCGNSRNDLRVARIRKYLTGRPSTLEVPAYVLKRFLSILSE